MTGGVSVQRGVHVYDVYQSVAEQNREQVGRAGIGMYQRVRHLSRLFSGPTYRASVVKNSGVPISSSRYLRLRRTHWFAPCH